MNYFLSIIIIIGLIFLGYRYIKYLEKTRGTEAYAKRRAIGLLFLAFVSLTGISNIFASLLFESLNLDKPINFELYSFVAYFIFALTTFLIFRNPKSEGTTNKQEHHGEGDNIMGSKIINNYQNGGVNIENKGAVVDVYKKLVDLNEAMLDMSIGFRNVTGKDNETIYQEDQERVSLAAREGNEFRIVYLKNKLYLNEESCKLIEEILLIFKNSHSDLFIQKSFNFPPTKENLMVNRDARMKIREDAQKMIDKLEKQLKAQIK